MKSTFSNIRVLLLGWLMALLVPANANSGNAYTVVKRCPVTNGAIAKLIVIPTTSATDEGLTALGDILQEDTKNDKNAFVLIFTDPEAVALRMDPTKSQEKQDLYARHHVGRYIRNLNDGIHEMQIFPSGLDGPLTVINY